VSVSRAPDDAVRCRLGRSSDTSEKGVYQSAPIQLIEDKLAAWLIEAALVASDSDSGALRAIKACTVSLANVSVNITELVSNDRLELFRQGLDEDMVMLRGVSR